MGLLLHRFPVAISFLMVFIIVRRFTGGYHATTYLRCKLCMTGTFCMIIVLTTYLFPPIWFYITVGISGSIAILIWGPVENPNKPLMQHKRIFFKFSALIIFDLLVLISLLLMTISFSISCTMIYTLSLIIILLIIPIVQRGGASK
jgi:accessory gene regulator B